MASVTVVIPVTKVSKTSAGKPYVVANYGELNHGGSICVFPKNGEDKAAKAIAGLKVGDTVSLINVGISDGKVYVYNDSTVQVAS